MSSSAPAPSLICDAVPAVWNAGSRSSTGLRLASASSVVSRRPSSRVTVWVPFGSPCSSSVGASIGTICVSKRPSAHATAARSCDCLPNASSSSRVTPNFSAMRSAPSNCDVFS